MIGKSIRIRGEVTGDEDVLIDGHLEGKVELTRALTIGRNANIQANVQASSVAVSGRFQGNIIAATRIEIDGTANVVADLSTPRVSIADGAYFKGSIEMTGRKEGER